MAACLSFSIGRHMGLFSEDSARERLILDGRDRQGASGKKARVAMAGTRAARARGAGRRPRPHPDRPSSEPSSAVRSQPGHRPLRAAASGSRVQAAASSLPPGLTPMRPRLPRRDGRTSLVLPSPSPPLLVTRVTPRGRPRGVIEGAAWVGRSGRRDSLPCVVFSFFLSFKHLDRWVEFAICGGPKSRAFSIRLERVLTGNRSHSAGRQRGAARLTKGLSPPRQTQRRRRAEHSSLGLSDS